jgi:hypothetical protein
MSAKYNSPFSIGKRQTVFIDPKDPRVRGWKAGITESRLGAELKIVYANGISPAGRFPYLKNSSTSAKTGNVTITPSDATLGLPSNLSAAWDGDTLVITFDFDFSDENNKDVIAFRYFLTTTGGDKTTALQSNTLNKDGVEQEIRFTNAINTNQFGIFQGSFSLLELMSYDSFGNLGETVTLTNIPEYQTNLPAPNITVTAINQGYTVDWDQIVQVYKYISIEEVVSDASTAPTSGYEQIYLDSIKPATIIRPTLASRWVRARFTDNAGKYGPYSTAYKVTPLSPVTVDNQGPDAPTSGTVTAGVDNSAGATIGFNAYVDISWSAVSDPTLKGYRIRFRENGTTNPYSYVDSPGTGTTFRLNGLAIGTVYEVAIASYDEFNNTSSAYFSIGTAQATGTPFIGKNVTTVGYFGASATGDTGTFKFGYGVQDSGGVKRGLVFNTNNYWYIDSAQSALFKLGGADNNYIQWDGSEFIVQGDLRAKKGNFQGNVQILSGGSLYSGTIVNGNLSGAGYILNSNGLTFSSATTSGTTTINGTTGLFTTISANIGGWDVDSTSIKKTSNSGAVTLDSTNAQIRLTSASYTAGIATPNTNSPSDIVFWAGGSRNTSASYYVTAQGILNAKGAILQGSITTGAAITGAEMKFGTSVGVSGEDGLYINSANYWYANAQFKIGNGILNGDHTQVRIDLGTTVGNSKFFLDNMPANDDDNFAGDPTITVRTDGRVVKGRRFLFNGTSNVPVNPSGWNSTTKTGTFTAYNGAITEVKTGDIAMIY